MSKPRNVWKIKAMSMRQSAGMPRASHCRYNTKQSSGCSEFSRDQSGPRSRSDVRQHQHRNLASFLSLHCVTSEEQERNGLNEGLKSMKRRVSCDVVRRDWVGSRMNAQGYWVPISVKRDSFAQNLSLPWRWWHDRQWLAALQLIAVTCIVLFHLFDLIETNVDRQLHWYINFSIYNYLQRN